MTELQATGEVSDYLKKIRKKLEKN